METNPIYSFRDTYCLVIGDAMIDAYVWGNVKRISPEAPVPVLEVTKREKRLGGAANVARNIRSLGGIPYLCSVIGQNNREDVFELMNNGGMPTEGIIISDSRPTTVKTRVISDSHHMIRIDEEEVNPISEADRSLLIAEIKSIIDQQAIEVVIFEDYDKGVISPELISEITRYAQQNGIPVAVDPKRNNFPDYPNVDLFKPNLKELMEGLNIHQKPSVQDILANVRKYRNELKAGALLLTLSENGVVFDDTNESLHFNAHKRDIADVSGAGDTVIATAALCLAKKLSPSLIAQISNIAGGLVCEKVGVVPIEANELIRETDELIFSKE